jgi:hypothetical protein
MDQGKNNQIKAKQHDSYITMTVLCILVPLVGLIIGIVYLTKDKVLDKKLGEHMVAFSILWAIIGGFGWMMLGSMLRVGSI